MTILVALFWKLELNIENEYSMSLSLWCEGIKFVPIRIYTRLTKSLKNLYWTILNYSQNEKNLIKISELIIQNEVYNEVTLLFLK